MIIPIMSEPRIIGFWAKIDIKHEDECWLFTGGQDQDGYGRAKYDGVTYRAHVIAFFIKHQVWPTDLLIMHSCDTPLCCNPAHLIDGTNKDNMDDMLDKGRKARTNPKNKGNNHSLTTLQNSDIADIRRLGVTMGATDISRLPQYKDKVSRLAISRIIRRETWQHLP